MHLFDDALRWLSMACLGVFLGAMLTEAFVLVPYWRALAPADFFAWYAANDQRLIAFFGPLTAIMVLATLAAAIASWWHAHPGARLAWFTATLAVVILASFFVYFKAANETFATASISEAQLPAELARWATWHSARTAVTALAFAAALLAVRR